MLYTLTWYFVPFSITKESIIDVMAVVMPVPSKIESCSQKDVEVHLKEIFVVSAAKPQLPLQIEDAARPIGEADEMVNVRVNQDTRLDNRVLDLRTPANQAIFKVEAGICKLFRDILTKKVSKITRKQMFLFSSKLFFRLFFSGFCRDPYS